MAAEVVNDFFRGRVDPSLLTEYPQQYDVRQDVLEPGKGDTFKRQLKSALNTRNILKSLTERPATLAEIEANSPGADSQAIMAAYQSYTIQRQEHYKAAAAKLPTLLKGLTQVELRDFEALQNEDDGVAIYVAPPGTTSRNGCDRQVKRTLTVVTAITVVTVGGSGGSSTI